MAQLQVAQPADDAKIVDLFEGQYESLVCGQHQLMVKHLRKILKLHSNDEKKKALVELNELMVSCLKESCSEDYTVGSTLGSAMKDTVVANEGKEQSSVSDERILHRHWKGL